MIIYEITATVDNALVTEYEQYMISQHIPELLATGHFAAAFFAKNGNEYRIGYHANSKEHLDNYLARDAERLRADFTRHFPNSVEVSRQILDIIELFSSP